jgi:putative two-component system response regulator
MNENPTTDRQVILIVDDIPDNLSLLSALLKDRYKIKAATGGERALAIAAADPPPDLILLDVIMPDMDGYEVCRRLKADPRTAGIPVIFLTARTQDEDEAQGLKLGAVDYLSKPVKPAIMLARVEAHLTLSNARRLFEDYNDFLEVAVQQRTREVVDVQDATIMAIAALAGIRDNETGTHVCRTQHGVRALARQLQSHPRFADQLSAEAIELLFKAAPLHDIGKIGVPDRILLNPGRLTASEFEIMKTHTIVGRHAIQTAEQHLGVPNRFLRYVREIVGSHHERWDGSGYPEGLAGDAIPLSARLMAVADVYDALIKRRLYKAEVPHDQAVAAIWAERGSHFDPDIVDAFIDIADQFRAIAAQFADDPNAFQEELRRMEFTIVEETIVLGGN